MNLFGSNQEVALPSVVAPQSFSSLMDTEFFLENPSSPYLPIIILLSHSHNVREHRAAHALAKNLVKRFADGTAPSVIGFSPQNSMAVLHGEVLEELNDYKKSAVVTLSAWAAQALGRAYGTRAREVPHIFTNVHSAGHLDLIDHEQFGSSMAAGVVVKHPDYRPMLESLNILRPTINEAFLIQQPDQNMATFASVGHGINTDNLAACKQYGIRTTPLRARDDHELREKLYNRLDKKRHAIFTGNDSMALVYIEAISEVAADVGVPVVTQDLASVANGAAIGCGSRPDFSTHEVAEQLHKVIVQEIHPSEIPLMIMHEPNEVRYNEEVMAAQGIFPTKEQRSMMKMRSIYKGY